MIVGGKPAPPTLFAAVAIALVVALTAGDGIELAGEEEDDDKAEDENEATEGFGVRAKGGELHT